MQTGTDKVDQKGQHGNYLVCNCRIGSKTDGIDELRYGYRKQQKLHALGLGLPVGNGRQNNTYHREDAPDVLPGKANAQHPEQDKYRKQDIVFFEPSFLLKKTISRKQPTQEIAMPEYAPIMAKCVTHNMSHINLIIIIFLRSVC